MDEARLLKLQSAVKECDMHRTVATLNALLYDRWPELEALYEQARNFAEARGLI